MPTYLPTIVILSAAVLAILVVLYRLYDSRVEQPKKLEDELREGLTDADGRRYKADVMALEPVRKAAAASSYEGNRVIIVRNFGKVPHKPYTMHELLGIEVFVDDRVVGRVVRGGPVKLLDDIAPVVNRVTMRLIFDDPADPDFELVMWDPHDNLTARAEGPRAAMNNARKWFYHVEAVLRRTATSPAPKPAPVSGPPPAPAPLPQVAAAPILPPATPPSSPPAPPKQTEGDVLNAPLIPYI
ncbi:hypothetical protein [Asticcacaulis sp. 201]|uniref:hypothetical protein n=1 Tax=Asticcacaulis sp. 201 TaxID=3028787 RepID=UPI002917041C|nr:hypothetical protein [Asticcacaulis sp. 201]MDV6329708.1 hypothetical protein [Asticcacaulis sp. 201]